MTPSSFANRWNVDLIEDYHARWRRDPASVDESWRTFFEGYELGLQSRAGPQASDGALAPDAAHAQANVARLISAYRSLGHYLAHLDPLSDWASDWAARPQRHELLDLSTFQLGEADLEREFDTGNLAGTPRATLRQLLAILKETYCRTIGVEYMHIQDPPIREWLQERMEPRRNRPDFARRRKLRILMKLHYAELFEKFLHTRFPGQKRFSLEGAETLIPILDAIVEKAPDLGIREIVLGMAHRGRLNVLANILNKPYELLFAEFEGQVTPESFAGDGDVKYHLGFSSDYVNAREGRVHLSLTPNPSHLEAVNPVVEGRVRAKQRQSKDRERRKQVLPLLIHGDAAFAGQGLVAETLNLSQLKGYRTGGTLHVIVNNQIGFTTSPSDARSTRYCTDVAKMLDVPIFHVNGEDPEACVFVAELALEFRQTFSKDVVIDLFCYRRHGHNEGDDPSFTQPLMYKKIKERPPIGDLYTEQLIMGGDLTAEETEAIGATFQQKLQNALDEVKSDGQVTHDPPGFTGHWQGLSSSYSHQPVQTGVPRETLNRIAQGLTLAPANFHVHPKIERILASRATAVRERGEIDWATAELLAFGSLLLEGVPVRLSGQDSRRGTFSQRHAVLVDHQTQELHLPLNHLRQGQADLTAYDSLLSEAAVLGFEYGYALDEPHMLVLWEAQFGDFANGAQVIIDQFIAAGESKWRRSNGVVLLLPHGYEGQGPEHSSGRLERFLQLCAEDNIQVCNLTTPAQYFHVLRRQVKRNFRKPLVILTPKSLLRHKRAVSPVETLVSDRFHEVLDDPAAVKQPRRVLLCSGKVHYDLLEQRERLASGEVGLACRAGPEATAILRLEQLYPFPDEQLLQVLAPYRKAQEWAWVQEESHNMGAWTFLEPRLRDLLGRPVEYVGRDASASPATGSLFVHKREQAELVEAALSGPLPHLVRSRPWPVERAIVAAETAK